MDMLIEPHALAGRISAPPSTQIAHRLLILSALTDRITDILCPATSQDIDVALRCLCELGAPCARTRDGRRLRVVPLSSRQSKRGLRLDCEGSLATLYYLLPLLATRGSSCSMTWEGDAWPAGLDTLVPQLERHGAHVVRNRKGHALELSGTVSGGSFVLGSTTPAEAVSGMLMAATLLDKDVELLLPATLAAQGEVDLTIDVLGQLGVPVHARTSSRSTTEQVSFRIEGCSKLSSAGSYRVEGDWSGAAIWLAASELSGHAVVVEGLNDSSNQPEHSFAATLERLHRSATHVPQGHHRKAKAPSVTIDLGRTPRLVPALACAAALTPCTTRIKCITDAGTLDTHAFDALCEAITQMGGQAVRTGETLVVQGVDRLTGGTVNTRGVPEVALVAAICASFADQPTQILGVDCVTHAYPSFFDDFRTLGGLAYPGGGRRGYRYW